MRTTDFDLFEINETFASQIIIGVKELELPEERVNPQGGGLALGHPFGGTGPRLILTLLRQLKTRRAQARHRRDLRGRRVGHRRRRRDGLTHHPPRGG